MKQSIPIRLLLPVLYARVFRQQLSYIQWWLHLPPGGVGGSQSRKNYSGVVADSNINPSRDGSNNYLAVDTENLISKWNRVADISSVQLDTVLDSPGVMAYMGRQLLRVRQKHDSRLSTDEKECITNKKLQEIELLLGLCRWLPWVKGVALTGSLSVTDPKSVDEDVDFFIICSNHRLWLTRPLLVWFSQLMGRRRTWRKEEANAWCFNLWAEERDLIVRPSARSYYLAHEVCQAVWLVSKDGVGEQFVMQNTWVIAWLPRLFILAVARAREIAVWDTSLPSVTIMSYILDICNIWAYNAQRMYMRPHQTTEQVTLHRAAFHR